MSSDNLLEAPIMFVGLTALSDDIKTTFFTYVSSAAEQTLYVETILFLNSFNGIYFY